MEFHDYAHIIISAGGGPAFGGDGLFVVRIHQKSQGRTDTATRMPNHITTKILDLHLFKFTHPKNKIPWGDFITKRFTDLRDTYRKLAMGCINDIRKIHKNSLSCLWTQIHHGTGILHSSDTSLEHQIKST